MVKVHELLVVDFPLHIIADDLKVFFLLPLDHRVLLESVVEVYIRVAQGPQSLRSCLVD